MALPSSGVITFDMIKTELGLTGAQSLNDLVQASNLADKTAPHNIHQFYGYSHAPTIKSTIVSVNTVASPCDYHSGGDITRYFIGTQNRPVAGDVIYTNSAATIVFNGGGNLYNISVQEGGLFTMEISTSGVVGSINWCGYP
ncbi:hypothetical protein OD91_0847 [Lutibacter sp. Hel_I_33_5]|uniref:hypothetical protein n=1 Tax=Lutibacter sp. Hel_I_33_5 TaxID=1566289 RepID=UPI0011A6F2BD|nr:hypothetical protein [Lutibacter sp. Hel_I_33_5]TVZ55592.1 hypothetical protein OD91_0847 [Lutibacter sp. Hel_I_33_5]